MNPRTLLSVCAIALALSAQGAEAPRPKLIVAILVDQLRYDYLERFHDQFVEGGFRLLTDDGAFMTFARYDFCPTTTGPGHATVFSGAPPAMHGIIGNDWYDKRTRKLIYCCADSSVTGVGVTGKPGQMSPRNFVGANFADELRLRYRSKVVGVSMKDRGAILPAGKKPIGAYWFENGGKFVTSSYYRPTLPAWVSAFNERNLPESYIGKTWDRLVDVKSYEREDTMPGEATLSGEKTPTFPHTVNRTKPASTTETKKSEDDEESGTSAPAVETASTSAAPKPVETAAPVAAASKPAETAVPVATAQSPAATPVPAPKPNYETILPTPFSNEMLAEFARAAIEGERLGEGAGPDLLTLSFSAIDACGHKFGPYSQEVQDITLRLDRQLAEFFAYLDKKFGLENVILTITADHGVMPSPEHAAQQGFGAQRVDSVPLMGELQPKLSERFGASVLLSRKFYDGNLYFNHDVLREKNIVPGDVAAFIRDWALATGKYQAVYSREQLLDGRAPGQLGERVLNGYHAERSGDVVLILKPFTIHGTGKTGTTHGSPYAYDTRVPVIFRGPGFKPGRYADEFYITDLVPTLCAALRMTEPPGSVGKPFVKALAGP